MSKYINEQGRFQSHQTPKVPDDTITLSMRDPEAITALHVYSLFIRDDELASAIRRRIAMMVKETSVKEEAKEEEEKQK